LAIQGICNADSQHSSPELCSQNPSAPLPSTNPVKQLLPEAPIGHRQPPPADQVPSEKNLMDNPNDAIDRENAALDRMTKGICRGC
jgi:hypothetical protein